MRNAEEKYIYAMPASECQPAGVGPPLLGSPKYHAPVPLIMAGALQSLVSQADLMTEGKKLVPL